MASLLDTIRQNSGAIAGQKQGLSDTSNQVAGLLRAKSGKAVGGGDTGASNLGEQQAVAQTNNTMQNTVAPQAATQQVAADVQATGAAQQQQQAVAGVAQARKFDDMNTKMRINSTLQDLEQSKGKLSAQDETAKVNMAAQNLRLQNSAYIQQLTQEGQMSRLNNDLDFKTELAKASMGDNEELMRTELGNKSIIDVNENDFRKAMGEMTADRAYDIFKNAEQNEKDRAIYTGISAVGSAAVGAAGSASKPSSSAAPASNNTGISAPSQNTTVYGGGSMSS